MKKVYFVTGNKGKYKEAKQKLSDFNIDVFQKDIGYPEIQADSLEEVANYGIDLLKNRINEDFILEDAGLFIESLEGFPGVYSKYVFYTIGCNGILKLLKNIKNRKAVFRSVYGYYNKEKKIKFFIGECKGRISEKIIGNKGFGYDPIFIPKDQNKTFAEMNIDEKNNYSHRGKSLVKMINYLRKL